jgi:hypothetical protein
MYVKVLKEAGYEEALLGLSLSFYDHAEALATWWNDEKKVRAARRAKALALKGGGHNKYLASIQLWLYVQAPRAWWSEFDTYKVGVTTNSSSTMHTLDKRFVTPSDFEKGTCFIAIGAFNDALRDYKDETSAIDKNITSLKMNLPEGWLQERQISLNYMALQNIFKQRRGHRLLFWDDFLNSLLEQVEHPEFLEQKEA